MLLKGFLDYLHKNQDSNKRIQVVARGKVNVSNLATFAEKHLSLC